MSKFPSAKERLPILDRDQKVRCCAETFARLLGHGGREIWGRDVAGRADGSEGRLFMTGAGLVIDGGITAQ